MGDSYTYLYRKPSSLTGHRGLELETSGGTTHTGPAGNPLFFTGFVTRPGVVAAGLLGLAAVARARYLPRRASGFEGRMRDPVVTSDGAMLRCESFSDCGGVYARLDLLPEILDGRLPDVGTTNVDVNEPLRRALSRVGDAGLLHLAVGPEDLVVTTGDGGFVERRVPLPSRWLRGFAEVQVISTGFDLRAELGPAESLRFLTALAGGSGGSAGSGSPVWVVPASGGLRRSSRPASGAVCLAGPGRLEALRPLLHHARALRIYGPPVGGGAAPVASAWELDLPGARFVLTLSPEVRRGFSGEGAVLHALAGDQVADDAEAVAAAIAPGMIEPGLLAERTELPIPRVRDALVWLGASGRVGYDVAEARHFARELPYRPDTVEALNPRLRAARALVADGGVRLGGGDEPVATVTVEDRIHRVRRHDGRWSCTCPWIAAHGLGRGPCKHILAVELAAREA